MKNKEKDKGRRRESDRAGGKSDGSDKRMKKSGDIAGK